MGITGYYHIFIEGFAKLAYPINSLQKKEIKFNWTEKCQETFEKIKQLLTMAPTLKIVDPCKYFVVCTMTQKKDWEECCYNMIT
jgi:adenosine deaminase